MSLRDRSDPSLPVRSDNQQAGDKVLCRLVPEDALERLLTAAESVGGQYEGTHPTLRECFEAAVALRESSQ